MDSTPSRAEHIRGCLLHAGSKLASRFHRPGARYNAPHCAAPRRAGRDRALVNAIFIGEK